MKLQLTTIATASLLLTSLVGFFPSNASASSVRGSAIIVADNHTGNPGQPPNDDGTCNDQQEPVDDGTGTMICPESEAPQPQE